MFDPLFWCRVLDLARSKYDRLGVDDWTGYKAGFRHMAQRLWDKVWINATIATADGGYGIIESGAVAVKDGRIAWIGPLTEIPTSPAAGASTVIDCRGGCITPGLIDCHTHVVYAGDRVREFEQRLKGATYEEIAEAGGGIKSTVQATRAASEAELFAASRERVKAMMACGTTTIEIKSGYGLDIENELKMLRVARRLETELGVTVKSTYLGAHTIPSEFKERPDDYVELICRDMIPKVAQLGLADAVDVYCETIAFSLAQTERIFNAALACGLALKCHAEQLSDLGASALAARFDALSVDHLEYLPARVVAKLAEGRTVPVLLPGSFYFLRETKVPPVASMRAHKVAVAIATDCNPGTSPLLSLPLAMNMACTLFKITPEEAFLGVTKHAAKALGIEKERGTLEIGKRADLAVWSLKHPAALSYHIGQAPLLQLVKDGKISVSRDLDGA